MHAKRFSNRYALFYLLVFSFIPYSVHAFEDIVVFGDSLSDTGNIASIRGDLPPPFFGNRISDGPVAVELLANFLTIELKPSLHLIGPQQGTNYAIAGATANSNSPIDLSTQVSAYLANNAGVADGRALFIIFIGGNDIRNARDTKSFHKSKKLVLLAAKNIANSIEKLHSAGAITFLIANSVDIGSTPDSNITALESQQPLLPLKARWLSLVFKKHLTSKLKILRKKQNVRIAEFDFFSFANQIINNPRPYNYINVTDACFLASVPTFNPDCKNGLNFDRFLFFDTFHPTAFSHQRIARAMYSALPEKQLAD